MCQYHSQGGGPTDWHLVSLGKYAIGGAGIVFTEETAVEERGRKTHASSLIQPLIQAMSFEQTAPDVARGQYWIHPALTEVIEKALLGLAD